MKSAVYLQILLFMTSCTLETTPILAPVEERMETAAQELQDLLTAPPDGWKLDYQPIESSGRYQMILNFFEDGKCRIRSDVDANNGVFEDDTIQYRVDVAHDIELVLTTYGVFHYLFEKNQNFSGAEFEFLFIRDDNGDLVFSSKSDLAVFGESTVLTFTPANDVDIQGVSTEVSTLLSGGYWYGSNLAGLERNIPYNMVLPDQNLTVSMVIDMTKRIALIEGIALGTNMDGVISAGEGLKVHQYMPFYLNSNQVIFNTPFTGTLGNINFELSSISLDQVAEPLILDYCADGSTDELYQIDVTSSMGVGILNNDLFSSHSDFTGSNDFYYLSFLAIYDQDDDYAGDLADETFEGLASFQMYYNYELGDGEILNAVGFVDVDEFNNAEFFLRGFTIEQTGNHLQITWTGEDRITATEATEAQLQTLEDMTDLLFGDEVFVNENLTLSSLFEFYNPCNHHKAFILKN